MSSKLSYVSTPRKSPIIYKTIIEVFRDDVASTPNKEFIIYRWIDGGRESLTYKELDFKATTLAMVLLTKGIKKGDKVALLGPNSLEKVVGEMAIILAGGVVVHLTMNLTDGQDVLDIFNTAGCTKLLVDPGKHQYDVMTRLLDVFSQNCTHLDTPILCLRQMRGIPVQKCLDCTDMKVNIDLPTLYPEDQVIIFSTSGSTGKPKLVPHSHLDLVNIDLDFFCGSNSIDSESLLKLYNDRPFGWIVGCIALCICRHMVRVFTETSTAIKSQSTLDIWEIIKEECCTSAVLLPYFLSDLIHMKSEYSDSFKLDRIVTGGQIVDTKYAGVVDIFTKSLVSWYGSSETISLSHAVLLKDDMQQKRNVGTPGAGVEIKVVDKMGSIVKRGEQGEICARSLCLLDNYYKDNELTSMSFLEGKWFRMGDNGFITKDGRIVVQGRVKDVISRGTRKIIPVVLEDVIVGMEGLTNVIVVPVPDKRLYEEVCVCFTVHKDARIEEEDVQMFCEEKFPIENSADGLGERPKYFLKFDIFPKLTNGKPDKRQLCSIAIDRLKIAK